MNIEYQVKNKKIYICPNRVAENRIYIFNEYLAKM